MIHSRQHSARIDDRSGMVLVLVLVVVMMLSFAVYSFSNLMVTEYSATKTGLTHLQRRELAASGIEVAAASMRQGRGMGNSPNSFTQLIRPIPLQLDNDSFGYASILRELPNEGQLPRFGMLNESAKLNLNALPLELSRRAESRRRLMAIPGLTLQVADAILDWMDADDEPSEYGAETSYYTAQSFPRRPRQGRFEQLRELLLVRGITKSLLFGEDQNGNGILDPEEDDGDANSPHDNQDGILQAGWSQYLTVVSGEGTWLPEGRRKIDLNQPVLATLFDQVEPILGHEAAVYIVAFRMRGAVFADAPRPDEGNDQERRRLERLESARQRLAAQLGHTASPQSRLTADQTERGGLSLSEGSITFKSLIDLFGGQVRISRNGQDTLLQSPWPADPGTIRRVLPMFEQTLTLTGEPVLIGRINVNEAPAPVLLSIPGMNENIVRAIGSIQSTIDQSEQGSGEFNSVAWLVSRGLISLADLREMAPYITTGGDVRGGFAIGQMTGHIPVACTRFLLDCSMPESRLLQSQDLRIMPAAMLGLATPSN